MVQWTDTTEETVDQAVGDQAVGDQPVHDQPVHDQPVVGQTAGTATEDHNSTAHSSDRSGRTAADLDSGTLPTTELQAVWTPPAAEPVPPVNPATIDEIEEALRDVVDPELGVNVVDLGLIYDLTLGDDAVLTIDMTLTSAACPLTDMIEDQVGAALLNAPEPMVADYRINWVWLPPWGPDRITDDGREQLRALGFNI